LLNGKGWHFDRQEGPAALHLMASPTHAANVDEFLHDVQGALAAADAPSTTAATYGDDVSAQATT
jgi:hypothetical protein